MKVRNGHFIAIYGWIVALVYLLSITLLVGLNGLVSKIFDNPIEVFIIFSYGPISIIVGYFYNKEEMLRNELQQYAEELRLSQERFRNITVSAQDAIIMVDGRGKVSFWNRAAEKIFGFSRDEALGQNVGKFLPDDNFIEAYSDGLNAFQVTGEVSKIGWTLESTARLKSGLKSPVEISLSWMEAHGDWGTICIIRDISERKMVEDALRESRDQFSALFNSSIIGVAMADSDGRVLNSNKTFQDMLGYTGAELLTKHIRDITYPDETDTNLKLFEELIAGKRDNYRMEKRYYRKDGSIVWADLLSTAVRDIDGNFQYTVAIIQDISMRKQLEEAVMDLTQDLEKKVRERTSEVESLLKQKDEFIHQLGHDLKTPLTPLVTLLPLALKREKDPKTREMMDVAIQNVNYMAELVVKTLELAKYSSSKVEFDIRDMDLVEVLDEVISTHEEPIREAGLYLVKEIDGPIMVKADHLRLKEVIDNLISNAVKYSLNGGGTLTIDAKKKSEFVQVSIGDTGIGLTEDQVEHIFDEFYKADKSRHDLKSSGLGLSICKRIIERHGGEIWAESEGEGKGATMYFTLEAA